MRLVIRLVHRVGRRGGLLLVLALAPSVFAQPALDSVRLDAAVAALPDRFAAPVRDVYRSRDYRPLWTDETGAAGSALQRAIADVASEGLDPHAYPVPSLASARSREAVEVAAAAALLRAADDLARGRVAPERIYDDWTSDRPMLARERLLRLATTRGPAAALRSARPPHDAYARLRDALARYRRLADVGGWPVVPPGPVLHRGDEDPGVPVLRDRLRRTGDLDAEAPADSASRYNVALEKAVRRFQTRHGLAVDGAVGPATRAALNTPAEARAQQIALNMERWRWLPRDLGATHLLINAAGMWLELVEGGERVLRLRTIVGTRSNPTPCFSGRITHAVFNPYWNVPESIARAEIWPQVARDAGYLARHHMRVLPNGRIRQEPGPDNPLGPVKLIFENPFGVRLHGTSAPSLFEQRVRAFSHGCIRVEDPLRLARRLLRGSAWDEARIDAAIASGREAWATLPAPVPLHVGYWTAWVEDDGTVHFRDDLYDRDPALTRALGLAVGGYDGWKVQRTGGGSLRTGGGGSELIVCGGGLW
jgi:murein L,D-transpeptidase YcbB/YkuD